MDHVSENKKQGVTMSETVNFKTDSTDTILEELADVLEIELCDELEATKYSVDTSSDDSVVRVQMFDDDGVVLSSMTTTSEGLYEFAQHMLRAYDQMEGL